MTIIMCLWSPDSVNTAKLVYSIHCHFSSRGKGGGQVCFKCRSSCLIHFLLIFSFVFLPLNPILLFCRTAYAIWMQSNKNRAYPVDINNISSVERQANVISRHRDITCSKKTPNYIMPRHLAFTTCCDPRYS